MYDGDEGLIFKGTKRAIKIGRSISFDVLKRKIHDILQLYSNQVILSITSRFVVSEKYIALHIYDDEDVEIMISVVDQQNDSGIINVC